LLLALLVIGVIIFAYYQFRVVEGNKKKPVKKIKKPVCNYDHCQKTLTEYQDNGWGYAKKWWKKGQGCHGCTEVKYPNNLPESDDPTANDVM